MLCVIHVHPIKTLLEIPDDEKLNCNSAIVRVKFLSVCVMAFLALWPLSGAVPAMCAAPAISLLVLFMRELLFSRAAAHDPRGWILRSFSFLFSIVLCFPIFLGSTLLMAVDPLGTFRNERTFITLGLFFLFGSSLLELMTLSVRSLRRSRVQQ